MERDIPQTQTEFNAGILEALMMHDEAITNLTLVVEGLREQNRQLWSALDHERQKTKVLVEALNKWKKEHAVS